MDQTAGGGSQDETGDSVSSLRETEGECFACPSCLPISPRGTHLYFFVDSYHWGTGGKDSAGRDPQQAVDIHQEHRLNSLALRGGDKESRISRMIVNLL